MARSGDLSTGKVIKLCFFFLEVLEAEFLGDLTCALTLMPVFFSFLSNPFFHFSSILFFSTTGALFSLVTFDITGLAGAGALSMSGLGLFPYRRLKLKKEMKAKINKVRHQLNVNLSQDFNKELNSSIKKINDSIHPYR